MKTRFGTTIFLLIVLHSIGTSQIADELLRENCMNDAKYWKEILSLTDTETKTLSTILYTSESSIKNLPKDISNYRVKLEDIEQKKQIDLSSLLGSSQLKTYTLLNESSRDFTSDMVFRIKNVMQRDSAFINEASMQMKSRYPVLLRYHQELINQMTKEDYLKLMSIKKQMFGNLDSLNNLEVNIIDRIESQNELPLETKSNLIAIKNIIDNYPKEYQNIYNPLSEHQQRWNKEMEHILLKHYPESNVNSMKEYAMFFRKTGISKELDRMLIYMLDPEDERRYFQILTITQKVEEKIFLIHK